MIFSSLSYCTQKVSIPPEEIKSSPIAKPGTPTPNPNPQSVYVNVETDTPLTPAENSMRTFLQNCQLLSTIEDRKAQNFFRVNLQKSVDENPTIDPNTKNQMTSLISNCVKPWYEKNAFFIFSGVGIVILGAYGIHSIAVSIQENLNKGKAVLDNINETVEKAQEIVRKTDDILEKTDSAVESGKQAAKDAAIITDYIKGLPEKFFSPFTNLGTNVQNTWGTITSGLNQTQRKLLEPIKTSWEKGSQTREVTIDKLMKQGPEALESSIKTVQNNLGPVLKEFSVENGWGRDATAKKALRKLPKRTILFFTSLKNGDNLFISNSIFLKKIVTFDKENRDRFVAAYKANPEKWNNIIFFKALSRIFSKKDID